MILLIVYFQKICTGTWQYEDKDEFSVPVMAIVAAYTFLFYVTLTIAVKIKGEKKQGETKYNNAGQVQDLSCLITDIITTTCMIVAMLSVRIMNKLAKDPASIMENPNVKYLRPVANPCLFVMATVQALHPFLTNKRLRKATWRLFFNETIIHVVE